VELRYRLATAAREVDLERLPEIERAAGRTGPDYGPMKPIPVNPQTLELASNIIWFEEPERALADPVRFMAYAMTYALPEDMRAIRQYVSDDDFRDALDHAPAGIIDPRSWAYWNSKMGRYPAPPLPTRSFGLRRNGAGPRR